MANSKRLHVTMDSCLAEYKNDKAASPDRQPKRQKTGEDNTDSAVLAMLQKLDASMTELTSRVDQLDPQVTELPHKQRDVVLELQKGVLAATSEHEASPSNVELAQNLMVKLQAASTKTVDASAGFASSATKQAAAMHTEPERAEGVKQASDAFSKIFASETGQRDKSAASAADLACPTDADSIKKQLLTLLGGMDSQDHLKLAGLKSFLNDEMADSSRSEGESISSGDVELY